MSSIKYIFKKFLYTIIISIIYILSTAELADTENLVITTYYPAPYGGYVSLLTTNNTWLARDGGRVGIGTTNPQAQLHATQGGIFNQIAIGANTNPFGNQSFPYETIQLPSWANLRFNFASNERAVLRNNGSLQLATRIGTMGFDADGGYPPGWGGGVHTWDVYAEGSVATGTGGGIGWFVNRNGLMWFAGSGSINGICTLRRNDGALAWRSCASGERLMGFAAANFAQEGACGDPAGGSCAFGGLRWVPRDGWMICCRIMF